MLINFIQENVYEVVDENGLPIFYAETYEECQKFIDNEEGPE